MKILILGGTGLLGFDITKYLSKIKKYKIISTIRKLNTTSDIKKIRNIKLLNNVNFKSLKKLENIIDKISPNIIINCVGIIKQNIKKNYKKKYILKINALVPKFISQYCLKKNIKFIHFSTDCVFNGLNNSKSGYRENDNINAKDIYGISKSKGEILSNKAIILRTSFVGLKNKNKNLLSWFLRQKKEVIGYKNVYFNGLTTYELAKILHKFFLNNREISGLYHLSSKRINKYNLLLLAKNIFQKNIKIKKNFVISLDRTLNSTKFQNKFNYKKKSWFQLVAELKRFNGIY
jgi:dTDP-4-dehydrorhamnose reductase